MTLHDEIMRAVDNAVRDAAEAAESACMQNRQFAASGGLAQSGMRVQMYGADAECTILTGDNAPALPQRDVYGIVRRIQTPRQRKAKRAAQAVNPGTLMRTAKSAMEAEFARSIEAQFQGGATP